ncbi:hypothetical protein ICR95_07775 [Priestia megaterium]|uniref:hypothetical protein n=1 Tax=Priestia megaterium TaxID=1404 RepID=UPI00196B8430|nr:hypothetical protein [Priestia megaterium]QSF34712.1 hypothetical protein ICR95_07775 [Priestia megaterium]
MKLFSPLRPWLNRTHPLPSFKYIQDISPTLELGASVVFDDYIPLYKLHRQKAQSLLLSWEQQRNYVELALDIINSEEGGWLDREEVQMILDEIGPPPDACYPIYMFTVKKDNFEEVLYIGKTSSKFSRFSGGHTAAVKMHHPKYNDFEKRVYFGCVTFLDGDNHLPLEWLHPKEFSSSLIDSIESQLIHSLKPALNTQKKKNYRALHPTSIHIQNTSSDSIYLDGYMISPHQKS